VERVPHLSQQQRGIVRGGKAVGLVCLFAGGLAIFSLLTIAKGDPKSRSKTIAASLPDDTKSGPDSGHQMRSRDDRE
jgi:hypothetical protein